MVRRSNNQLNATFKSLSSCPFINIDNLDRNLFTSHGLHLNMVGKEDLATVIIKAINDSQYATELLHSVYEFLKGAGSKFRTYTEKSPRLRLT